jgi:hypothetical protein
MGNGAVILQGVVTDLYKPKSLKNRENKGKTGIMLAPKVSMTWNSLN